MDVVVAAVGLVLLSPLFLGIAFAVWVEDRGPIIYRSERLGVGLRRFECLKFRSMRPNAESRLKEVLKSDPSLAKYYGRYHKLPHDPRITVVGNLLRRTSLDELPQLVNVLLGEMSLVGPRPYLVREYPMMASAARDILAVPPGLTGYWQVGARNNVSFDRRVRMERFYAQRHNPAWDLQILLLTPIAMLKGDATR